MDDITRRVHERRKAKEEGLVFAKWRPSSNTSQFVSSLGSFMGEAAGFLLFVAAIVIGGLFPN